jgi:hypothetical protein
MASRIGSPIYLGKPTAEVWRTDCKGERYRIICLNLWDVLVKEDEKDKKKKERHVERGDQPGRKRIKQVAYIS